MLTYRKGGKDSHISVLTIAVSVLRTDLVFREVIRFVFYRFGVLLPKWKSKPTGAGAESDDETETRGRAHA